ncbi:hypothetical protein BJX65DRAFT_277498 [Aspergillus insuetus]
MSYISSSVPRYPRCLHDTGQINVCSNFTRDSSVALSQDSLRSRLRTAPKSDRPNRMLELVETISLEDLILLSTQLAVCLWLFYFDLSSKRVL